MYVLLGVVILIGALVAYASTRPTDFRYVRVTTIQASPEQVFAQVNDFHRWEAWSPWAKLDPQMETTYSGDLQVSIFNMNGQVLYTQKISGGGSNTFDLKDDPAGTYLLSVRDADQNIQTFKILAIGRP